MAEFDDLRTALNEASVARRGIQRDLAALREKLALAKRARSSRSRIARRGRDNEADPGLAELDRRIAALDAQIATGKEKLSASADMLDERFAGFSRFTDPRENLGRLSDATPILLMPLRIETRFKRAAEFGGERDELWVRVYPDDILVDTFEETLSESEAQRARAYFADLWRANGVEAEERGAWRVFLSGQASGRSHWITETYQPLNAAEKPLGDPTVPTVILTIVTQEPLADPEKTTVRTYWSALWKAGDDSAGRMAAENALVAALGAERAGVIRTEFLPRNLTDLPPSGADRVSTTVIVAFLEFPDDASLPVRQSTWSQVAEARALPDRLVLLGYVGATQTLSQLGNPIPSPLAVTPDPSADPDDQTKPLDNGGIQFDEGMRWMVDFERAVAVGMGFRVPLDEVAFNRGFDELMVLGVRLRSDADEGKATLEQLFGDHQRSRSGFSIVPQGQPTNNVEGAGTPYSWLEDSDVSFDQYFKPPPPDPDGWFERSDGRALAALLGLDPAKLATIPFYHRTDGADARAMNMALFPATLGYFLESMLHPIFDEATVEATRDFFTKHVVARGPLPAIRVGKQPYGILPATVRSRIAWFAPRPPELAMVLLPQALAERQFLQGLYQLLRKVEADLTPLLNKVSFIGKPGADQHQVLLDVVGLHAASTEFQQRYAESFQQLYNRLSMQGVGQALLALILGAGYVSSGLALLSELGYTPAEGAETPDILEKLFLKAPNLLKGDLIDDRSLSETDPIHVSAAGGANYLSWLAAAARTSHEALRRQDGFTDGVPTALLYLMMHHALDLSFVETSIRLSFNAGLLDAATVKAAKREPAFIQMTDASLADPTRAGDSRWKYLARRDAIITGNPSRSIGDFIPTVLTTMQATAYLNRQLTALDRLASRPTAALERAFVEHLDLCTYRFDAWYGGLLSYQLEVLRESKKDGEGLPAGGLYLGAYGWLEHVKPEFKQLTPVELPDDLAADFSGDDLPPLTRDSTNEGYIHAPSLNHAITAAVLRNGYLSNATPENPQSLAINLSSERVRVALSIIEGLQQGQSLGALLGYRFERGLHDRHDVEVDAFIYDLRKAFPLVADRLIPTKTGATDELGRPIKIGSIEARNVIDGLALVEKMKTSGITAYPFGITDLPAASDAQRDAISQEADRIAAIADAVADIAMAESVHQVVQGNYDRAGPAVDTYSKGKFPMIPDVVQTPRSGTTLTHRVALHLSVGLDPSDAALTSPRAKAEPAVNALLAALLPPAAKIAATAVINDPRAGTEARFVVTAADLGLLPLDLLALVDPDNDRSGRILDDLIEGFVIAMQAPRPDATIAILYRDRIPAISGHIPFFELAALTRSLRDLVLRSRPLKASDMTLAADTSDSDDADVAIAPARITLVRDLLAARRAALEAFRAPLQARIDAHEADQLIAEMEGRIGQFSGLMRDLSPFAALESGTSGLYLDRRRIFTSMLTRLQEAIDRFNGRLVSFDQAIAAFDTDPAATNEQKFLALEAAERFIATAQRDTLPALPASYRNDLVNVGRPAFVAARDAMVALHNGAAALGTLHAAILALNPGNAAFDATPIVLDDETAQLLAVADDMSRRSTAMVTEMTTRLAAVQAAIDEANSAAEPKRKVTALTNAARLMLGDDFPIVPDFALASPQTDEWQNAWGGGVAADTTLLDYQVTTRGKPFPVDDWLTGVARVRPKVKSIETTGHLAMAFGTAELVLQPLQFPYRPETPWLALDFPATGLDGKPFELSEDKLLYTAHFAAPFDGSKRQAGLLLDEWTEIIPRRTEDTGITFHYDRPNSEPPQVMLLALSPQTSGAWHFQDLVDTVRETMDLAKKRAIEPDHIDTTAYARFLPATVSAVTLHPITAALNLAFNNNLAKFLSEQEDR